MSFGRHTLAANCELCEGWCLSEKPATPSACVAIALHIGQHVRHRDYQGKRVTGRIRTLSIDNEDGALRALIVLDAPLILPASDYYPHETRLYTQYVAADELSPFDERDELIAQLVEALSYCTTDEGPDQSQLDRARAVLANVQGGAA